MDELKPCPFCGSSFVIWLPQDVYRFPAILCENCFVMISNPPDKKLLLEMWNRKHVGIDEKMSRTAVERFQAIWDSINAKHGYGWDANPWVWVYTFERVDKPEGWCER